MWFYPSKVYSGTKEFPYAPELITQRIMLNPLYKVKTFKTSNIHALCDSGAFQDIDRQTRLTPEEALNRQLAYLKQLRKLFNNPLWNYEAISIYDQMVGVDEQIVNGKKIKRRGTEETGILAIKDTLVAAEYYSSQRQQLPPIIYIAQGINAEQYVQKAVIPLMDLMTTNDYFGFGGFCIIGRQRKKMLPIFFETVVQTIPILKKKGIKRIHIFGVCLKEAIEFLNKQCKNSGILCSTDSSAPELNAVAFGKGYNENLIANVKHGRKWIDYNPIELAHDNIRKYNNWIEQL